MKSKRCSPVNEPPTTTMQAFQWNSFWISYLYSFLFIVWWWLMLLMPLRILYEIDGIEMVWVKFHEHTDGKRDKGKKIRSIFQMYGCIIIKCVFFLIRRTFWMNRYFYTCETYNLNGWLFQMPKFDCNFQMISSGMANVPCFLQWVASRWISQ